MLKILHYVKFLIVWYFALVAFSVSIIPFSTVVRINVNIEDQQITHVWGTIEKWNLWNQLNHIAYSEEAKIGFLRHPIHIVIVGVDFYDINSTSYVYFDVLIEQNYSASEGTNTFFVEETGHQYYGVDATFYLDNGGNQTLSTMIEGDW